MSNIQNVNFMGFMYDKNLTGLKQMGKADETGKVADAKNSGVDLSDGAISNFDANALDKNQNGIIEKDEIEQSNYYQKLSDEQKNNLLSAISSFTIKKTSGSFKIISQNNGNTQTYFDSKTNKPTKSIIIDGTKTNTTIYDKDGTPSRTCSYDSTTKKTTITHTIHNDDGSITTEIREISGKSTSSSRIAGTLISSQTVKIDETTMEPVIISDTSVSDGVKTTIEIDSQTGEKTITKVNVSNSGRPKSGAWLEEQKFKKGSDSPYQITETKVNTSGNIIAATPNKKITTINEDGTTVTVSSKVDKDGNRVAKSKIEITTSYPATADKDAYKTVAKTTYNSKGPTTTLTETDSHGNQTKILVGKNVDTGVELTSSNSYKTLEANYTYSKDSDIPLTSNTKTYRENGRLQNETIQEEGKTITATYSNNSENKMTKATITTPSEKTEYKINGSITTVTEYNTSYNPEEKISKVKYNSRDCDLSSAKNLGISSNATPTSIIYSVPDNGIISDSNKNVLQKTFIENDQEITFQGYDKDFSRPMYKMVKIPNSNPVAYKYYEIERDAEGNKTEERQISKAEYNNGLANNIKYDVLRPINI